MNRTDSIASSSPASQNRRDLLVALGAAATLPLFAACATPLHGAAQLTGEGCEEPGFAEPPQGTQHRVELVLSAGGARGFAHLGVLRVLERERWRSDPVVGISAGAIVGAMYASGLSVAEIDSAAATPEWSVAADFDPVRSLLGGIGLGVVPGERLQTFLRQHLPAPIERFPIPFAAVAADMEQGEVVALNQGDAARAVLASCTVPGLYAPVRARGRLLADGQEVSPLPVLMARSLGAVRMLAVDVVYLPQHSEMSNPIAMLFQSMIVSGWRHALAARALADLVITPELRTTSQLCLASLASVTRANVPPARRRRRSARCSRAREPARPEARPKSPTCTSPGAGYRWCWRTPS